MAFAAGARIGSYEVVAPLGAGGMGEVYRARDTRLKREVALKVLPESFASDPDRLARFAREAEVLAALNHPNIAAIYGVEDASGTPALVMELVEGQTLADRIARGPLVLDEALPIARQIVEALEAAHEQDIVHRDLKPANIKLRPDGTVKVLDFGLAKLAPIGSASNSSVSMSPTITSPALVTGGGVLLGTAAYMSPEQAKGHPVDRRSDIWAFGCVLFEMLSGQRAFAAEDVTDTLAAVLRDDPRWSVLPSGTPPQIVTLLRRCLQKNSRSRLPDIGVARLEIEDAATAPPSATHFAASPRRVPLAWAFVVAALVLALGAGLAYVRFAPGDQRVATFTFAPPDGWTLEDSPRPFTVSPDGNQIAFVALDARGRRALWVRALDSLDAQMLSGTDDATTPFWSPDSRFIAFRADDKLKKIAITGGAPTPICDVADVRGGTWSRDGVILFASGPGLQKVSEAGGISEVARTFDPSEGVPAMPQFLPDGRHFLYITYSGIHAGSLDSTEHTPIVTDPNVANFEYVDGRLIFLRDTTLMAQPFDVSRRALTGTAVPIADSVHVFAKQRAGRFSASENGVLVYQTGSARLESRLVLIDRNGKILSTVADGADYADVSLSNDETRAAVSILDPRQRTRNIWVVDIARGRRTQLTFTSADDLAPVWAPDDSWIAFSSGRQGRFGLYRKAASGAGEEEELLPPDAAGSSAAVGIGTRNPLDVTKDGGALLYISGSTLSAELTTLSVSKPRVPVPYLTGRAAGPGQLSPDNRWIARVARESGPPEIWVTPYRQRTGLWRVSENGGGSQPRWRGDGREIFYIGPDSRMMAASVNGDGEAFKVESVRSLFAVAIHGARYAYDVTADGQRFLVNTSVTAENTPPPLRVVLNWPAATTTQ